MKTENEIPVTADEPIHPTDITIHNTRHVGVGLTKREYFAAMAMQGILSCDYSIQQYCEPNSIGLQSVQFADALIAALNEGSEG